MNLQPNEFYFLRKLLREQMEIDPFFSSIWNNAIMQIDLDTEKTLSEEWKDELDKIWNENHNK